MAIRSDIAFISETAEETRGARIWNRMLEYRKEGKLSLARAKLVTESYKKTEGLPAPIRRAKAFENIVTHMPIFIEEEDLLAGSFSTKPMYFEWYPEFAVDQEMLTQNVDGLLAEGFHPAEIREIVDYFKDRCLQSSFLRRLGDAEMKTLTEVGEEGAWVYRAKTTLDIDRGYHAADHNKALQKGFLGVLAEVEKELENTNIIDDESYRKANFLRGLTIVLKAGIHYAQRHAVLAREMARQANGQRKKELEKMAAICERVPAHPARSFHEALQSSWFLHVLMHLESRAQESPGRMDQFLFPFYQKDRAEGKLTQAEALELLECLRIKMSTLRLFNSIMYKEIISGEAQYHNVTLGGQTPDGEDATNELSYLFLEAARRARTTHPTLSVRWHDKMPRDFALKALDLIRLGLGFPALFNDKSSIPWLLSQGVPMEVARTYCLSGCVHHTIPGQTSPFDNLFISIPKCLEITLHNGMDPRTGKQLGPPTGEFEKMESFEELEEKLKTQIEYFSRQGASFMNQERIARAEIAPVMLLSAFMDDCIQKGRSCSADGARYNIIIQIPVGMIDTADSLAAIQQYVFAEGTVGKKELLDALAANFENHEKLHRLLLNGPKYGNDEDSVDRIASSLYSWWWKMVLTIEGPYGVRTLPAPYSISAHEPAGRRVGALPDGRLAGFPLADGSVSPCPGMDTHGPTAVINSAGKIDQMPLFGTLLNMKFHPSALRTEEDLFKLRSLIQTYFDYGGKHVQFNVVDHKVLRKAQERPEEYRNLVVRVAGYSALFTELSRKIQDEIITRTEFMAV
jgi:pyruvate formate-lyase/glycerol dehydratase family glycyl radical enzyme